MAAAAGFSSTLKIQGTSTAMTGEACTDSGDHMTYQITSTSKRIIDPAVAVVVKIDGEIAAASTYLLDYLFGKIIFYVSNGAGPVITIDGAYLPTLTVALVGEANCDLSREKLETTAYGDTAPNAIAGLKKASGSFTVKEELITDQDPGAGSAILRDIIGNGTPCLVEFAPGGGTNKIRAWVQLESGAVKGESASLVGSTVNFSSINRARAGRLDIAGVGFGS